MGVPDVTAPLGLPGATPVLHELLLCKTQKLFASYLKKRKLTDKSITKYCKGLVIFSSVLEVYRQSTSACLAGVCVSGVLEEVMQLNFVVDNNSLQRSMLYSLKHAWNLGKSEAGRKMHNNTVCVIEQLQWGIR